jgi:hypothetical protein
MSMTLSGVGRIVRQPKLFPNRKTPGCYLTLAHDEGSGEYRRAHFTTFLVEGKQAEVLSEWGLKGRLIHIQAVPKSWVKKTAEGNRTQEMMSCVRFDFLDKKPKVERDMEEDLPPPEEVISTSSEEVESVEDTPPV